MAKVITQEVTFKISKLVKDTDSDNLNVLDHTMIEQVAEVIETLVNDTSLIVEV